MWWCQTVIPTLERYRQEEQELKVLLSYTANLRTPIHPPPHKTGKKIKE